MEGYLDPDIHEAREQYVERLKKEGAIYNQSVEGAISDFQETLTTGLGKDIERLQYRLDEIARFLLQIKTWLQKAGRLALYSMVGLFIYAVFKTYENGEFSVLGF